MNRAVILVGLGFGDEGKGAAVDFLTREYEADLVVRYCGGCQAGHNVELPDGRRHTFSQFGAGTLAGARTYLGPAVVMDPSAMRREAAHLTSLGFSKPFRLLTFHPRCLVTTPWHKVLNWAREAARGAARHGTCGQGVGEARSYWLKHGRDAIVGADLGDVEVLREKLELQRQRTLLEIQEIVEKIDAEFLREMDVWNLNAEAAARELSEASDGLAVSDRPPDCETAIFEGAQGVLLDEYRGFHPHTTWSTVTPHHAWELIEQAGAAEVAVLGVTRTYTTRHGDGPLPTFSADLTARLPDPGNPRNRWQGGFRCGWLDLPLLRYAAEAAGPLDGLVANHLDQVTEDGWLVCDSYKNVTLSPSDAPNLELQSRLNRELERAEPVLCAATAEDVLQRLNDVAPVVLRGAGPTYEARRLAAVAFRKRVARPEALRMACSSPTPFDDSGRATRRGSNLHPVTPPYSVLE
jgi:adenylosuccinate synthase